MIVELRAVRTDFGEDLTLNVCERRSPVISNQLRQAVPPELSIRAIEYFRQAIGRDHQEVTRLADDVSGSEVAIAEHGERHLRN